MNTRLSIEQRNAVLHLMAELVDQRSADLLIANQKDSDAYDGGDLAMRDRLKVDDAKIKGMQLALRQLADREDPLNIERFSFTHDNGIQVSNRTAPFGTILIIYESRPDVTIEAAGIAFKSGNRILLKGGKEALNSNLLLVELWHEALTAQGCQTDWVQYLNYSRTQTQAFLENPTTPIDLIVPRGGEKLIAFVKAHATCPVIVSGRGNNFVYVAEDADPEMALSIIINAKTAKISACNALDKVLIASDMPHREVFLNRLVADLKAQEVSIITDQNLAGLPQTTPLTDDAIWHEEFLDYKIVLGQAADLKTAIEHINKYSGGHSASIITTDAQKAQQFMESVDAAAVYHNASTRFTDGGQFGLAGELAISTDKLHQRGPIGLQHLVTNKWYVTGQGQIR
ncbi:MAG: glutamate-5-semialdehyde dehydrogenase [Bacteroidota bacterium]